MDAVHYVYEHVRPDTNEAYYVGKGKKKRAYVMSGKNVWHTRITNKLKDMGLSPLVRIIKDGLTEKEALSFEKDVIRLYRALGVNLTNMTEGGEGISNPSTEVREKMSLSSRSRWLDSNFRERHSSAVKAAFARPEVRERLSLAGRGRPHSEETKAKLSKANKGRKIPGNSERFAGEGNPFWGKHHAPETIKRISEKRLGTSASEDTKAKMRAAQSARRAREKELKPPPEPKAPKVRAKVSPETRKKLSESAKRRGISDACRIANKNALTGRKRAPFSDDTIQKMRIAAKEREMIKRKNKEKGAP